MIFIIIIRKILRITKLFGFLNYGSGMLGSKIRQWTYYKDITFLGEFVFVSVILYLCVWVCVYVRVCVGVGGLVRACVYIERHNSF